MLWEKPVQVRKPVLVSGKHFLFTERWSRSFIDGNEALDTGVCLDLAKECKILGNAHLPLP